MKKAVILGIFLLILVSVNVGVCSAGAPSLEWAKTFGGSSDDNAQSVQQTADGGYIVAGSTVSTSGDVSGNHGGWDVWVLKLNATGNLSWKKCFGGSSQDYGYDVQQTADNGYILAGATRSFEGDVSGNHGVSTYDIWVVKINTTGTLIWQKCLGGTLDENAYSVRQTSDGGYIIAGDTLSNNGTVSGNHGSVDAWVVKLNATGGVVWQKCLGGTGDEHAYSVQQTADGGYIVAGSSTSIDGDVTGNHGSVDYWVVKLDANGNLIWQKSLGGSFMDYARSIQQTADGGYIVAGNANSIDGNVTGNHGVNDMWVVKLDGSGNLTWQKSLGGSNQDIARSIQQTDDNGYIVTGWTYSNDHDVSGNHGSDDAWVVKLDSSGNLLWQKCIGGTNSDYAYSINQTPDGGFVFAGESYSGNNDIPRNQGGPDLLVVKLAAEAALPVANFTATPLTGSAPLTVFFTDTSTGSPASWNWTFGDGKTSTNQNPMNIYLSPGIYTVTLTVTNASGSNTITKTNYITAGAAAPVADFSANTTAGTPPLTVQFTDGSSNIPTSWNWSFGDGIFSAVQNPVHIYTSAGTYTVTLRAGNSGGNNTVTRTNYISVSESGSPASAGSMFRGNPQHTGVYDLGGSEPNNKQKWIFKSGEQYGSTPVIANGVIYAGSLSGTLSAINAQDGSYLWNFSTPSGGITSSPAVVDGIVYFGGQNRNIYAVWAGNGTEKWHFTTSGSIESSPAVSGEMVYIGSSDSYLYALHAENGTQKWRFYAQGPVKTSPAVDGDTIYTGMSVYLFAVNAADGTEKWRCTCFPQYSSPAVAGGVVYVGGSDDKLHAVYAANGTEKWNFTTDDLITSSPAVTGGMVYFGSYDQNLYAIHAENGTEQWHFETPGYWVQSSPAIANNTVYFGSMGEKVYALRAEDGSEKWHYSLSLLESFWGGNPVLSDGVVYVLSDWSLYAIGNSTPLPVASFSADVTSGTAPVEVRFEDTSDCLDCSSRNWSFGDGGFSTERDPVHGYVSAGRYTVRLTIANSTGSDTVIKTEYIRVDFASASMYRANARHTGVYPGGGIEPDNTLVWEYATGDRVTSSPVVAGGITYVGSWDDNIYAFFANNGTKLWNFTTGGNVPSSPAVGDGVVYAGSKDGFMYAIHALNGTEMWRFNTGGSVTGSPVLAEGMVVTGTYGFSLGTYWIIALDAMTGREVWRQPVGNQVMNSAAAYDNGLFFYGTNGYTTDNVVRAVYAQNGTEKWYYPLLDTEPSEQAISNGVLFFGTKDGWVHAVYAINGSNKWVTYLGSTTSSIESSPAIADGTVYIGSWNGLYALDEEDGTQKWHRHTGDAITESAPAVADGVVYISDLGNTLSAIHASNGTVKWDYPIGPVGGMTEWWNYLASSSPVVSEGIVYIGSNDNKTYAIGYGGVPPAPQPAFTANVTSGSVPLVVRFTDATMYEPVSWTWDFGDGTFSGLQNPVHSYLESGTYAVTLTVTNAAGANRTLTRTDYISVTMAVPSVTANVTYGVSPLPVLFNGTSQEAVTGWNWSFGEGTFSDAQNPTHTFTSPGIYTVALRISKQNLSSTRTMENYISAGFTSVAMLQADPRHTGVFDSGGIEPDNRLRWNFTTGDGVYSSAAVTDGVLYIGSNDNGIYAVYADNGTLKWKFTTGGDVVSSPAVADGVVYTGSLDNNIYALYAENGTEKWRFATGGNVTTSPAAANGVIYAGNLAGYVVAVNAMDGTERWRFNAGSTVRSSPAVADGVVYFGSFERYFYAVDAGNGTERWNYHTGINGFINGPPTVADGVVYFGSGEKKVYALRISDGTKLWEFASTGYFATAPAVADGVLYVGGDDYKVHALFTGNGTEKWQFATGMNTKSPVIANGTIYVGSYDNSLYALYAGNGTKKWQYTTGSDIASSPAVADGVVYFGSGDKNIYAIGNRTPVAPVAGFTANITVGPSPLPVRFTDTSSGIPYVTDWNWSFGDGSYSSLKNPVYTYLNPGNYTVSLTATNTVGSATEVKTDLVRVVVPVSANFTASPNSGRVPLVVRFNDTSQGYNITSRDWSFGDGTTASGLNPVHLFVSTGEFSVRLNVTGEFGRSSVTRIISVLPPAEQAPETLIVRSASVPPSGQNRSVTVEMANVSLATGISFTLNYNQSVVHVADVLVNPVLSGASVTKNINNTDGQAKILVISDNGFAAMAPVPLVSVIVSSNGFTGEGTNLSLVNATWSDAGFSVHPFLIENGYLTIVRNVTGDFNNNDRVDIGDVTAVAYMVVDLFPDNPDADFNMNGNIDIGDASKIAWYYVGKIPTL